MTRIEVRGGKKWDEQPGLWASSTEKAWCSSCEKGGGGVPLASQPIAVSEREKTARRSSGLRNFQRGEKGEKPVKVKWLP